MIEVLKTGYYERSKSNCGNVSGLRFQVTLCKYKEITFCVRESLKAVDSFLVSSGERWGDKIGKKPSIPRQALELLAPEDEWGRLAEMVHEQDGLNRPVLRNKRFTKNWIKKELSWDF